MVLFGYNRRSSIPIGAPQSGLALWYFIQRSILHFCPPSSSRMGAPRPQSGAPLFYSRLFTSLHFSDAQHRWAAPLDMRSLAWDCTPQFHSALLHHHHHSPCPHCTPHRHSSCLGGAPLFPANSSYCLSNSILNHRELTSQVQPFRYHKSRQTTLEFNFGHSPGPNHSEICRAPPGSLCCWWIVCSCVCRPWWVGRSCGWHWDYVRLITFDRLAGLLILVYLLSLFNHSSFSLVLLNVAMQTLECWTIV